jgi:hypothetical protein
MKGGNRKIENGNWKMEKRNSGVGKRSDFPLSVSHSGNAKARADIYE